jgi:hypothetical protein
MATKERFALYLLRKAAIRFFAACMSVRQFRATCGSIAGAARPPI